MRIYGRFIREKALKIGQKNGDLQDKLIILIRAFVTLADKLK